MGVLYTRKQGDTADDLVYQLLDDAGEGIGLAGATIQLVRHGKPAINAAAVDANALPGNPNRGRVRVLASAITTEAGIWDFDTVVNFGGGSSQKFPRDGHDRLHITPATVAAP